MVRDMKPEEQVNSTTQVFESKKRLYQSYADLIFTLNIHNGEMVEHVRKNFPDVNIDLFRKWFENYVLTGDVI